MSLTERIDACVESLIRNDYVRSNDILGVSEEEIDALISKCQLSGLPEDYKLYLTKYGKSTDLASCIPIDRMDSARDAFEESLNEIGLSSEIPERYLVFSGNMDYSSALIIESKEGKFEMILFVIGDDFYVYPIISFIDYFESKTRQIVYNDYA